MAYKVIATFRDLQDNNHLYHAGDTFPRKGTVASPKRITELATNSNKAGKQFIELIPDEPILDPEAKGTHYLEADLGNGQEEAKSEPKKATKKRSTKKKA